MDHPIYRVVSFDHVAPYTLRVVFDDASVQVIDFLPVLRGELFGPLKNRNLFNQVSLDQEAHTLVWSNGADFDPATLHDWDQLLPELVQRAKDWELQEEGK